MNIYDEVRAILKIPDVQRISFGREFSRVFRPLRNHVRVTNQDYDYSCFTVVNHFARTDPLTNSIAFVENALEIPKEIAKKLDLNPALFRQLYGLGSWVNEFRHWTDLIELSSCAPQWDAIQADAWTFCVHVAIEGFEALRTGKFSAKSHVGAARTALIPGFEPFIQSILGSILWTETMAFDEEKRCFETFNSKEAKTLYEACNIEVSEMPCSGIDGCAVHDLASHTAQIIREKFGSLEILERTIRKRLTNIKTTRIEGSLLPDQILQVLLVLDSDKADEGSIDHQLKNRIQQLTKSEVSFESKMAHTCRLTTDRLLTSDELSSMRIPLVVGRIHDVIKSMISIDFVSGNQLFGRIYADEHAWNRLDSETKRLCIDLFKLRLDTFHAMVCSLDHHLTCKNRKKCPVIESAATRTLLLRPISFGFRPYLKESLNYLKEKYSGIPNKLNKYYRENRMYFERIRTDHKKQFENYT